MAQEFTRFGSSFVSVVVFAILIQVNAKALTDEQKEQLFTEVKNCVKETGVSDDEFETIVANKELPTSKEGKCFTKCLMEKMEYLDEGGKINAIAMQASLEENMDKKDDLEKAKEIFQQCIDSERKGIGCCVIGCNYPVLLPTTTCGSQLQQSGDNCEYAYGFSKCVYMKMKEAGIQGP